MEYGRGGEDMKSSWFVEYKDRSGRTRVTKPTTEEVSREKFKLIGDARHARLLSTGFMGFNSVIAQSALAEYDMIKDVILPSHLKKIEDINKAIAACNEHMDKLRKRIRDDNVVVDKP